MNTPNRSPAAPVKTLNSFKSSSGFCRFSDVFIRNVKQMAITQATSADGNSTFARVGRIIGAAFNHSAPRAVKRAVRVNGAPIRDARAELHELVALGASKNSEKIATVKSTRGE